MESFTTQDQLYQLFQHVFGRGVEVTRQEVLNQYQDYLVLHARLKHPSLRVVVKLAGPASPMASAFDRTAMLYQLVAKRTTIPMPEILAMDVSAQSFPWRYLVLAYIPGEEWAYVRERLDDRERSSAYNQIGSAVAQLHMVRFPAFGELAGDGSVLNAGSYLAAFTEHARKIIKKRQLHDLFSHVLDQHSHLFTNVHQASLCHEDLHGYNILFQQKQERWLLASILDFDKAWAGHAEIDLARMEFWRGMTSPDFWQAYREIHSIDPGYERRRPVYQLLWCYEYARSTPQHLADTQQLCARNGFPSLDRFE